MTRVIIAVAAAFAALAPAHANSDQGDSSPGSVHLLTIDAEIERGIAAYVRRGVADAEQANAEALVVRLDTPGGRVDAALDMRDALLDTELPTIAFIDRNAYSAGALIAIATEQIWMAPGAVMGAATPVRGKTGEKASEKMVSAVRSAFAATAEQRGRDPALAEAMVDASVEVEGVVEKGKLLTLTADQALAHGYAEGKASDLEKVLSETGHAKGAIVRVEPSPAEWLAGFVTIPAVASLLMSLGFLGLLFELKTAGWGIGGTLALIFLGLFFGGHLVAGLAGWEGIVLVVVGIALIGVEVFVIPGFGVAGVLGGLCMLGGMYVAMVDFDDPTGGTFWSAAGSLGGAFLLLLVGGYLVLRWLPGAKSFRGVVLQTKAGRDRPEVEGEDEHVWGAANGSPPAIEVGSRGVARTGLRPAGVAEFDGRRIDVVTSGDYVQAGSRVEVVDTSGNRTVVEPRD